MPFTCFTICYCNVTNIFALLNKQKQGPLFLTAWHSLQAKSLCEMLIERSVPVNYKDVAWHSPEVMLGDVTGKWPSGFGLIFLTPNGYGVCMFLLVQHLMFDPVSSCGFAIACHRVHSPPRAKVINQTALFFAARKGHSETIQYLLKQGADPNIVDVHGETALLGCQQGCLFWSEDGGQKFAEWAVCSYVVTAKVIAQKSYLWPLFDQIFPASNSESRKNRVPVPDSMND